MVLSDLISSALSLTSSAPKFSFKFFNGHREHQRRLIAPSTYLNLRRSRDDNNVVSLIENPSERSLARRSVVYFGYLIDAVDSSEDLGKVLLGVSGK